MIARLAEKTGTSKTYAQKVLHGIFDTVADELKNGGKVTLTGFGTFSVAERKPRTGRHPQTGEILNISAAKVPRFKAGKTLRSAAEQSS